MAAPDVPGWLDGTKGALSCQHSSVDLPLAAPMVVIFNRDGIGDVLGRVRTETVKLERLTTITAVRRNEGSMIGCEDGGNKLAAANTTDGGCRKMTAGLVEHFNRHRQNGCEKR